MKNNRDGASKYKKTNNFSCKDCDHTVNVKLIDSNPRIKFDNFKKRKKKSRTDHDPIDLYEGGCKCCGEFIDIPSQVKKNPAKLKKWLEKSVKEETNWMKKKQTSRANGYLRRGFLRDQLGDRDGAVSDYTRSLKNCGTLRSKVFSLINRGNIYLQEKRTFHSAIRDFRSALKLYPDYWKAYKGLGKGYFSIGDNEKGFENLEIANEIHENKEIISTLGFRYMKTLQYEKSLKHFDELIRVVENEDNLLKFTHVIRGKIHFKLKNYDQAIKDFEVWGDQKDHGDVEVHIFQAQCYLRTKDKKKIRLEYHKKAFISLQKANLKALEISKNEELWTSTSCHRTSSFCCINCLIRDIRKTEVEYYRIIGKTKTAMKKLNRIEFPEQQKGENYVFLERARIYHREKKYDLSLEQYEKAVDYISPETWLSVCNEGGSLAIKLKKYETALRILEATSNFVKEKIGERLPFLEAKIAGILEGHLGQSDRALQKYEEAAEMVKENFQEYADDEDEGNKDLKKMIFEGIKRCKSPRCNVCGKVSSKKCGRCESVFYCSVEHQKQDWKEHKKQCCRKK